MIETLFLLIALANMGFAAWTTFYGPRWMLGITAACSLLAWLAIFISAGRPVGWGLLASIPWTALLLAIGWMARDEQGWQHGWEDLKSRLPKINQRG